MGLAQEKTDRRRDWLSPASLSDKELVQEVQEMLKARSEISSRTQRCPAKGNEPKKEKRLNIRITVEEANEIRSAAELLGMTASDFTATFLLKVTKEILSGDRLIVASDFFDSLQDPQKQEEDMKKLAEYLRS